MGIMFIIVPLFIACVFVFVIGKIIGEWVHNNNAPRLSVSAVVVDKRRATHHHHSNGHHHHTHSYHVTFEVQSGDRMALRVPRSEFDLLVEGDEGTLSFQGTRYLGFTRTR